jgi:hypothetical protein
MEPIMKPSTTILSLLATAALSLPLFAHASGALDRVPGSTDEARYAAQYAPRQTAQPSYGYDDPAAVLRASSTDEARAVVAKRDAQSSLVRASDCMHAGAVAAGSTDEARASVGRRLTGSFDECSPHAGSSATIH